MSAGVTDLRSSMPLPSPTGPGGAFIDAAPTTALPCETTSGVPRITHETLDRALAGEFDIPMLVLDCRYSYEYDGGHIPGALRVGAVEMVRRLFADNVNSPSRVAIVFHCEFSQERGPKAARYFRRLDRDHNIMRYPELTFPDVYILDGGYKRYAEARPGTPYISMWADKFNSACVSERAAQKQEWKRLERADGRGRSRRPPAALHRRSASAATVAGLSAVTRLQPSPSYAARRSIRRFEL